MALFFCENRRSCTDIAVIASIIIGIVGAFLQITGIITLAPVFLLVALVIAIVYLAITLLATSLTQRSYTCTGVCNPLTALLAGILGTILFSIVLLAATFDAGSVIGAIIVGALLFFFSLMIIATACLAKSLMNCNN